MKTKLIAANINHRKSLIKKRYKISKFFNFTFIFKNNLYFIEVLLIIIINWKKIIFIKIFKFSIGNYIGVERIENQLHYYNNLKSNKIKVYKIIKNPKISIISPMYNRKSFIIRFLNNIQFQRFQDIEIILVNDCSNDNSKKIIDNYLVKDNRMKIINNKKRKGTFFTRNLGVLFSKGKYVFIPDPDDIFSKSILSICYKYAEKYNYDIIKFDIKNKYGIININNLIYELRDLKQPELSTNLFYKNNELLRREFVIWNKLIKKEIYLLSLNTINKFYLNMYITFNEDQIMNYFLLRSAKTLYYINDVGYYYTQNSMSITRRLLLGNVLNFICKFLYMKILYEYSKNTKYEKDMSNLLATNFLKVLNLPQNYFNLTIFNDLINIYHNSKFISGDIKNHLLHIKNKLIKI